MCIVHNVFVDSVNSPMLLCRTLLNRNRDFTYIDIKNIEELEYPHTTMYSGVSRILFRGGVQIFLGKVGVFAWREAPCSAWRATRLLVGFGGMLPREIF